MRFVYALLILVWFQSSSCKIQDVELEKFNDYNVTKTESDDYRIKINVRVNNPNSFNIKVKKTDLKLDINGNDAGPVNLVEPIRIIKRTSTDYDLILIADGKQIGKAVARAAISIGLTGKANLTVKGWIKGKVYGIGKKIDINHKQSFSLKDLGIGG